MNKSVISIAICLVAVLISCNTQAPDSFSWDNVNGTSFISEVHSQNFPSACNSGWAFSAIDVFNSKMKIARKAASPDL